MPSASETTTRQGEVLHPQATSPCQYQWQHAIDAWQNTGNGKCSLIGGCLFCCSACSLSGTTKTRAIHDLTSIQIADCSNCSRSTTNRYHSGKSQHASSHSRTACRVFCLPLYRPGHFALAKRAMTLAAPGNSKMSIKKGFPNSLKLQNHTELSRKRHCQPR